MKRAVITTSSSSLDNIDISNNIGLIRLHLNVHNVDFIDGKNITLSKLQKIMLETAIAPVKTSPAPLEEVKQMFSALCQQDYTEVFVITLSSQMSESYNIVTEAAQYFSEHLDIHVFDAKELNFCEAVLALEAEHMTEQGYTMEDIAQHLTAIRDNHQFLFAVDDLSYLIKNKKLSATAGFFANLLKIKPVLQITDEGQIVALNKIRHIERALDFIINEFTNIVAEKESFLYVLDVGDEQLTQKVVGLFKDKLNIDDIPVVPVSSISVANHGPNAIGIGVFTETIPWAVSQLPQAVS